MCKIQGGEFAGLCTRILGLWIVAARLCCSDGDCSSGLASVGELSDFSYHCYATALYSVTRIRNCS